MFPLLAGIVTLAGLVVYCWWIEDELPEAMPKQEMSHQQPQPKLQDEGQILITNWPTRRDAT